MAQDDAAREKARKDAEELAKIEARLRAERIKMEQATKDRQRRELVEEAKREAERRRKQDGR